MCSSEKLQIPGCKQCIMPGNVIKLGRFDEEAWMVCFGWFSWGGNRPFCGWYLTSIQNSSRIKPLQLPDLDDIYFVQL